jgi:Holliday junction resolvasome RuvABC endonuclease subunit
MYTLGLDPSLTGFGWVIHNSSVTGKARVVKRGRWKTTPKMIWVERYVLLRQELMDLLDHYPIIEAAGVESPPFGELWSEGLYALFLMVNEALWSRRKDVVYFDPSTVKMLVKEDPKIRKGKMFKSDMIAAAKAETGIARWSSDEADAYHVAKFSARFWMLLAGVIQESDLTPSEHQAFAKIHTFKRGKRAGQTVMKGAMFKENQRFFRFSQLPRHEALK